MGEDFSVWKYLQGKANMKGRVFLKDLFVGNGLFKGEARREGGWPLLCYCVAVFVKKRPLSYLFGGKSCRQYICGR